MSTYAANTPWWFRRARCVQGQTQTEFFKDSPGEPGFRKRLRCVFTRSDVKSDHWTGRGSVQCVNIWLTGNHSLSTLTGCWAPEACVCVCLCSCVCACAHARNMHVCEYLFIGLTVWVEATQLRSTKRVAFSCQAALKFRNGGYCCVRISIFKTWASLRFSCRWLCVRCELCRCLAL